MAKAVLLMVDLLSKVYIPSMEEDLPSLKIQRALLQSAACKVSRCADLGWEGRLLANLPAACFHPELNFQPSLVSFGIGIAFLPMQHALFGLL